MSLLQVGLVVAGMFAAASYVFGWALCRASALADERAEAEAERETETIVMEDEAPPLGKAA